MDKNLTAADRRRHREQLAMVSDAVESRKLWKEQFGTQKGWKKVWDEQYTVIDDEVVPKVIEPPAPTHASKPIEVPTALAVPEILYQDNQKHSSYSLLQVKGGWTVVKYGMDGKVHTVEAMSEVEHKNFACNRMINFIRMEARGK